MTEQQIREQTQAVFDAYLALSRCGISLSDFLEIRREAIQELNGVSGDESIETTGGTRNVQKKETKKGSGKRSNDGLKDTTGNSYGKPSSTESKAESKGIDATSAEVVPLKGDQKRQETIPNDADEPREEYNDFLDDFSDPWN